jgi:hypothetical protein
MKDLALDVILEVAASDANWRQKLIDKLEMKQKGTAVFSEQHSLELHFCNSFTDSKFSKSLIFSNIHL